MMQQLDGLSQSILNLKYQIYDFLARDDVHFTSMEKIADALHAPYKQVYRAMQVMIAEISNQRLRPTRDIRDQLLEAQTLPMSVAQYRQIAAKCYDSNPWLTNRTQYRSTSRHYAVVRHVLF